MPIWLLPVEFLAKLALKFGIQWVEKKYPGSRAILDKVLEIIKGVSAVPSGAKQLDAHLNSFICMPGTPGCPPDLK